MTTSWDTPYADDPEAFDADTASFDEIHAEISRLASEEAVEGARSLIDRALLRFPDDTRLQRWRTILAPPVVRAVPVDEHSTLAQMSEWLAREGAAHVGRWVVLEGDQFVKSAETLEELRPVLAERPRAVALKVYPALVSRHE